MQKDVESLNEHYKLISKIGSGSYGEVYKALHIATSHTVAIKVCKLLKSGHGIVQKQLVLLAREMIILHKLSQFENNDYTVKLLDVFVNRNANE
jgi:serine/threonine protein kinase